MLSRHFLEDAVWGSLRLTSTACGVRTWMYSCWGQKTSVFKVTFRGTLTRCPLRRWKRRLCVKDAISWTNLPFVVMTGWRAARQTDNNTTVVRLQLEAVSPQQQSSSCRSGLRWRSHADLRNVCGFKRGNLWDAGHVWSYTRPRLVSAVTVALHFLCIWRM